MYKKNVQFPVVCYDSGFTGTSRNQPDDNAYNHQNQENPNPYPGFKNSTDYSATAQ
jgi:hypothetical protein